MSPNVEIRCVSGEEIRPFLPEISRLRIEVFREFPYLYEGSADYESDYLEVYTKSPSSIIVLAIRGSEVIGASTGLPLIDADPAFRQPFSDQGIDPAAVFYFGESVLKKSERGQGMGHQFFNERERHARAHGFQFMAFCAVERASDHPLRPTDDRSNENFWINRGYHQIPRLRAQMEWKQIDSGGKPVTNNLTFWLNKPI